MSWREVSFKHHPLGARVPGSPHSVLCSLPTVADIIGYEEKNPNTQRAIHSGYPRFVTHYLVRQVAERLARDLHLADHTVIPVDSEQSAQALCCFVECGSSARTDDFAVAILPNDNDIAARAKSFTQHTGTLLSSRHAEDWLVAHGALAARHAELVFDGDASAFVKREIARLQPPAQSEDVFLARAGANAFYAVHRAVSHIQQARGRTVWVQFGWLYLDTGCVLDKFGAEPIKIPNLSDLDALEALLSARHDIAAIVCEAPNNPLLQSCDLERLSAVARKHDVLLVIDPTVSSVANVPALRYADVMVTSLTKYAAREADVMIGAVAICPDSRYVGELRVELAKHIAPPYVRDLQRLAHEMQGMSEFVAQLNDNARAVHTFLMAHPCVYDVRYAGSGAMMSFSVRKPLAEFFDGLPLVKAASFGAEFSIISPFMYLAHYDLVSTADGRAHLAALGIDPNLLRLSVGLEPTDELIAALSLALM